jgi:hypothetical protein
VSTTATRWVIAAGIIVVQNMVVVPEVPQEVDQKRIVQVFR